MDYRVGIPQSYSSLVNGFHFQHWHHFDVLFIFLTLSSQLLPITSRNFNLETLSFTPPFSHLHQILQIFVVWLI
jgi:hypothetical protein